MKKSTEIYQNRINKVIDFVNDNLDRSISLEELASIAMFSPFHFHRIFVAVTGESVNFFTNRVRLEKSARLLKYTSDSISYIGMKCGFSSPSTFSRAFKEYFSTTPSAYRKVGIIKNSKICKELFPLNAYLVNMSDAEKKTRFPVMIRQLPVRRVAYIRVLDSYREGVVLKAFEEIVDWAKEENLFNSETIFGMSVDDPMVTPKEKYRYEVCITIPGDFEVVATNIETTTLPACKYAIIHVEGSFELVATAINYLMGDWIINSHYEPEHLPGMEVIMDNEHACNWSHFNMELCAPIKHINTI